MTSDFINKYRPQSFEEFFGAEGLCDSLQTVLDKGTSRSFLFVGPSGCGKTTLARLVGLEKGVPIRNIVEIDAATHSGADHVRSITESLKYKAFGKNPNKLIIVDECQSLSKKAWEALLKSIEEPPPHVHWCLCTTEVSKVPATIKTRCMRYDVKPLSVDDLFDLLVEVREMEELSSKDDILHLVADTASGSPRQALVNYGKVAHTRTRNEAKGLLNEVAATNEIVDLCRALVKMANGDFDFVKLRNLVSKLEGQSPESIRIVVTNYIAKVLSKEQDKFKHYKLCRILEAFGEPFRETDKLAPVYLAIGQLAWGEQDDG